MIYIDRGDINTVEHYHRLESYLYVKIKTLIVDKFIPRMNNIFSVNYSLDGFELRRYSIMIKLQDYETDTMDKYYNFNIPFKYLMVDDGIEVLMNNEVAYNSFQMGNYLRNNKKGITNEQPST